jgi:hypothetical protein
MNRVPTGSVWCWSASVALIVAIFEPWVVAAARRRYELAAQLGEARPQTGELRQPLWHFVMNYTMTPQERLQDWREGGPQSRFELDSRTGPFETLISSGTGHGSPRIDAKEAAGDERRLSCGDRAEARLDRIGRWVEGWMGMRELQDRRVEPLRPI